MKKRKISGRKDADLTSKPLCYLGKRFMKRRVKWYKQ